MEPPSEKKRMRTKERFVSGLLGGHQKTGNKYGQRFENDGGLLLTTFNLLVFLFHSVVPKERCGELCSAGCF